LLEILREAAHFRLKSQVTEHHLAHRPVMQNRPLDWDQPVNQIDGQVGGVVTPRLEVIVGYDVCGNRAGNIQV